MKKLAYFFLISLFLILPVISASEIVTNIPDSVSSFDEWKIKVLQANGDGGFLSTTTGSYFGFCERTCSAFPFSGDCNPCKSGEVASLCSWMPDSMSSMTTWSSGSAYCNDWLRPYDYYNRQCYCKTPTTQCSGGADPGARKCQGSEIWQCNSAGTWEYTSNCPYGCSSGTCQQQQCTDHVTKKCEGTSVYWYDSCGNKQEQYEICDSDEVCQNAKCVRVCQEGFIGSQMCSGNKIVQQYQLSDCSTEIRDVNECAYGCQNSQCVNPSCSTCPNPTSWSQCANGNMFRTNYQCSADTNYECRSFTETTSCECGTSNQCEYDETCESNVCTKLSCSENEIADNHECIEKSSISTGLLIGIIGGILFFIILIVVIILIVKMKGGKNHEK